MSVRLDHIVFGCLDLDDGAAALAAQLGAPPGGRGVHKMMGTHNALWNMGDAYIELVAINPAAPHPGRPRWFGLDDEATQGRLAAGPRLLTWAVSGGPLAPILARAPVALGPAENFSRDDLAWTVAVPVAGTPGLDGAFPLTLDWTAGMHPAKRLPDVGLRCGRLSVAHLDIEAARSALGEVEGPVEMSTGPFRLVANLTTPKGAATFAA